MRKYIGKLNNSKYSYKNSFIKIFEENLQRISLKSVQVGQGMMMWITGKVVDGSIHWKQS